jgi:alginate O-acetyltransferase complex protein AlgI
MSFDSVTFWLFFAVAWAVWRWAPFGLAKSVMLAMSLGFYAWWRWEYLFLILFSALVDYHAGARIHAADEPRARRRWLFTSLAANLGLLAVFKYTPFVAGNLGSLAGLLGYDPAAWELADWVVPVGISFYTFQTLSYSLDIYHRRLAPCPSFRDFFLFVSFFPQLVAGPIVRASELLPQFRRRRRLLPVAVQRGLYCCIVGLCLKVVVADNLGYQVKQVFDPEVVSKLSPLSAWLGTLYFGAQIYADFAGYSLIAIGLAYLMGLRFPRNFDYPYIAQSLSEFWTRWHITLSQWLRDYLYVPLGGNRKGPGRTYVNLLLTMLLGGLWHGAAWTYVAWGALHGVGLALERLIGGGRRAKRTPPGSVPAGALRLARILVVFVVVHVAWVFFRAPDFPLAWALLERMFVAPFREPFGLEGLETARHLALVGLVAALHLGQLAHEWFGVQKTAWRRAAVAAVCLLLLTLVQRGRGLEFIYFQF